MAAFLRHLETVQRPSILDKSRKNDEFSGTPDTQPETPGSEFYTDRTEIGGSNDDQHPLFSPIANTTANLGMDYEAEGTINSPPDDINDADAALGSSPPASESKSSKRHVFNALRAIAKSPSKDESFYSTKKDFISALHGFAVSPTKDEELVGSKNKIPSALQDGSPAIEAVHPFDDSMNFNIDINYSLGTPEKEPPLDGSPIDSNGRRAETTNGLPPRYKDINIGQTGSLPQSPEVTEGNNNDSSASFSPETKEIFDLNCAMNGLTNNVVAMLQNASDSTVKSQASAKVMSEYRVAVEDYRQAIMEFQTEMSHATNNSINSKTNIDSILDQIGNPLSAIKKTQETIDIHVTDQLAESHNRLEVIGVKSRIDDFPVVEQERQSLEACENQSEMDATFVTAGEYSVNDESPVTDVPIETGDEGLNESMRNSINHPVSAVLTEESLKQLNSAASLISHFEKKSALMPIRMEVPNQKEPQCKSLSIDKNVFPEDIEPSEGSPCDSIYTNTGSKTIGEDWENKQRFLFRSNLPDISPDKTTSSSSVKSSSHASSNASTDKMKNISMNLLDEVTAGETSSNSPPSHNLINLAPNLLDEAMEVPANSSTRIDQGNRFITGPISVKTQAINTTIKTALFAATREGSNAVSCTSPLPLRSESQTVALLNKYSSPSNHEVHENQASTGLPPRPPKRSNVGNGDTAENRNKTGVIEDILKLNLSPSLTKEILQSLNQANHSPVAVPNLGIQHIYTTHHDRDDCSEVSSLGNASTLSSAALSTLSAMARKNPTAPIEKIIRDFKSVQNTQVPVSADLIEDESSDELEDLEIVNGAQKEERSSQRSAFGSPFHTADIAELPIRLNPPKIDSQKGRRGRIVNRKTANKKETPALAPNVLDDFQKLQKQLKETTEENKLITKLNQKVDYSRDNMQNEKLMNNFEQIEHLKSQGSGKDQVPNVAKSFKVISKYTNSNTKLRNTQALGIGTSNDWFNESKSRTNKNEQFSSLLKTNASPDTSQIERKKQIYEPPKKLVDPKEITIEHDTSMSINSSRRKKNVLKKMSKMMRRKKKSSKDDDASSSIGISSLASLSTTEGGKKKSRFKFLPSLRRKNKKGKDLDSSVVKVDTSQMFEAEGGEDENGAINDNFIIDTMEMLEIEDLDDDALDESSASECEKRSFASGASEKNKHDHAYVTLS